MRMPEKYSSPVAYFWAWLTTAMGTVTLEKWAILIGALCAIGNFLVNWYYKRKEDLRNEHQP